MKWVLLCVATIHCTTVRATDVFEVLAVEYPPFTSSRIGDGGLAFQILQQAFPEYRFKPYLVPPKRAYQMMQNGQWCMSFYPSSEGMVSHKIVLSEHQIGIGLIRSRQPESFKWGKLDDLAGLRVALLRSGDGSAFANKFNQAGLLITYTETIQQSIDLMLRKRVDLAMYDDYNYKQLPAALQQQIQFSETMLLQTPVTLFTNPNCHNPLPEKIKLHTLPAAHSKPDTTSVSPTKN
jgi:polar amino acid transport system substrate-binding protein